LVLSKVNPDAILRENATLSRFLSFCEVTGFLRVFILREDFYLTDLRLNPKYKTSFFFRPPGPWGGYGGGYGGGWGGGGGGWGAEGYGGGKMQGGAGGFRGGRGGARGRTAPY
jgi:hypothetical protein